MLKKGPPHPNQLPLFDSAEPVVEGVKHHEGMGPTLKRVAALSNNNITLSGQHFSNIALDAFSKHVKEFKDIASKHGSREQIKGEMLALTDSLVALAPKTGETTIRLVIPPSQLLQPMERTGALFKGIRKNDREAQQKELKRQSKLIYEAIASSRGSIFPNGLPLKKDGEVPPDFERWGIRKGKEVVVEKETVQAAANFLKRYIASVESDAEVVDVPERSAAYSSAKELTAITKKAKKHLENYELGEKADAYESAVTFICRAPRHIMEAYYDDRKACNKAIRSKQLRNDHRVDLTEHRDDTSDPFSTTRSAMLNDVYRIRWALAASKVMEYMDDKKVKNILRDPDIKPVTVSRGR